MSYSHTYKFANDLDLKNGQEAEQQHPRDLIFQWDSQDPESPNSWDPIDPWDPEPQDPRDPRDLIFQ